MSLLKSIFIGYLFAIDLTFSATYYVDNVRGNDGNSGKSTSLSWKTLAKVNGFTFASGDIISLKCDSRFLVTAPIANKSNLTFNSYGTGARPVIDGGGTSVCISLSGTNVTLNGLKIVNGYPCNVSFGGGATYITVESCNVDSSTVSGGGTGSNPNCMYTGQGSHITIRNSTMSYSGSGNGIYIDGTDDCLFENDTLMSNFHDGFRIAFGEYDNWQTNNLTVRYCVIKYNHYAQIENSGASNSNFYYNLIITDPNNTSDHAGTSGIYMHDQGYGYTANNCNYYNNTIINNRKYGWDIFAFWVQPTSGMTNITFKNNIFYCQDGGQYMQLWQPDVGDGVISGSWTFTNNLYYTPGSTAHLFDRLGTYYTNLNAWHKATGYETNSHYANPLFTNYAAGDYSLSSGSPAINSGTFVGLTTDINGNSVPSNYPDMGAFQHLTNQ